jgi:hypothetical protein
MIADPWQGKRLILEHKLTAILNKNKLAEAYWNVVEHYINKFEQNGGSTEDTFIQQTVEPFFDELIDKMPSTEFLLYVVFAREFNSLYSIISV